MLLTALIMMLGAGELSAQGISARALNRAMRNGQSGALYGSNPYENQGEEGQGEEQGKQPQDSTEKRIKKPLESYFFGDSVRALPNFAWNRSLSFNRVSLIEPDTTLKNFRIDYPFYREDVGDIAQGALGQTSMPINYFRRPTSADFTFAQPYYAYTFNAENVPFYNVKKPMTLMTYFESGQKRFREEQFQIMHAQNISPSTGFNVNYKSRGTRGQYDRQRTKNHNLSVAVNHTGRRYSVHAGYYNNHIEQQENGGVVGEWAIADTVFQMPSGVPMKLADAQAENTYRNNGFYVVQSYGIPLQRLTESDFSMAGLSAVYVGHAFEYSAWSKTYSDVRAEYTNERDHRGEDGEFVPATGEYYKNWYINPLQTRDSLYERRISNRFFVQVQPWNRDGVVGTIDAGVGMDHYLYSQFSIGDYLTGKYRKQKETALFAYGAVSGKIKKYVDWDANTKFYPAGYRGGDLFLGGHIALKGKLLGESLVLDGRFSLERRTPGYWQENLYSNHFMWSTPLDKETETRLEVKLELPNRAFEAGLWQSVVSDKIYYGSDAHIAQSGGEVSLTGVYLRKDFRFGGFHLDNRVLLQWSTNEEVVPVPLAAAYLSYYYEFWVVRNVLRLQLGLDGRFHTKYYAPSYNPSLSAYYNQRELEVGGYPYLDAFAMAKWKRMRIFLKYQHLNKALMDGAYFSAAGYPLNPGMFKMGISWSFYD